MNPFELADYFGFVASAVLGGLVVKAMKPRPPKPLKPMCSCNHGYGAHEDGGQCHAKERNRRNLTDYLDPCPCRRYDGPDPAIFGFTQLP